MLNESEIETLKHVTLLDLTMQKEQEMRRRKMSRRHSRRNFKRHSGTHPKNNRAPSQRGGYRL